MAFAQQQPTIMQPSLTTLPFKYHNTLHPKIYVAPYTTTPIETINADMNKEIWSSIPWSHNFDDIRGPNDAPNDERPTLQCRTRMKMAWDDDYLYILAMIESDFEVRATFTTRNSPIFQQDSDFEVFIDPLGSCYDYKEMEMNALNTVWNLMLDKPYWDGGSEHSGRIANPGDDQFYDVEGQKTAVKVVEGSINSPTLLEKERNVWVVEVALNHKDTLKHITMANERQVPMVGDRWRINFSRVEEKGKTNWTWQEQRVWDPILGKHVGKVDMHLPDAWGYVQFGKSQQQEPIEQAGEIPTEEIQKNGKGDPLWPLKLAASNVYYAQRQYKETNDKFAKDLDVLADLVDSNVLDSFDSNSMKLTCTSSENDENEDGYLFQINDDSLGYLVSITDKRLIEVKRTNVAESGVIMEKKRL
jgi:hypothetical protein